jgi:hypothetical protein
VSINRTGSEVELAAFRVMALAKTMGYRVKALKKFDT